MKRKISQSYSDIHTMYFNPKQKVRVLHKNSRAKNCEKNNYCNFAVESVLSYDNISFVKVVYTESLGSISNSVSDDCLCDKRLRDILLLFAISADFNNLQFLDVSFKMRKEYSYETERSSPSLDKVFTYSSSTFEPKFSSTYVEDTLESEHLNMCWSPNISLISDNTFSSPTQLSLSISNSCRSVTFPHFIENSENQFRKRAFRKNSNISLFGDNAVSSPTGPNHFWRLYSSQINVFRVAGELLFSISNPGYDEILGMCSGSFNSKTQISHNFGSSDEDNDNVFDDSLTLNDELLSNEKTFPAEKIKNFIQDYKEQLELYEALHFRSKIFD